MITQRTLASRGQLCFVPRDMQAVDKSVHVGFRLPRGCCSRTRRKFEGISSKRCILVEQISLLLRSSIFLFEGFAKAGICLLY